MRTVTAWKATINCCADNGDCGSPSSRALTERAGDYAAYLYRSEIRLSGCDASRLHKHPVQSRSSTLRLPRPAASRCIRAERNALDRGPISAGCNPDRNPVQHSGIATSEQLKSMNISLAIDLQEPRVRLIVCLIESDRFSVEIEAEIYLIWERRKCSLLFIKRINRSAVKLSMVKFCLLQE